MRDGYWVIRTYEAGSVGEKTKFFFPGTRPKMLGRKQKSAIKKQEQNEYSALKSLARLINANFGKGDLLLGLDYSPAGMKRLKKQAKAVDGVEEERDKLYIAAERELGNALRRVKRDMEAEGKTLRYVSITSDMDGDTGKPVRVHHHLIVPAEAKEAFMRKWEEKGLGGVSWTPLSPQEDYTQVAEYMLRQVRRIKDRNKYASSRNLVRPQPKDRIVMSAAEVRVPKGGRLIYRSEYRRGQPQYVRYVLPSFFDTTSARGDGRANTYNQGALAK